MASSRTPTATSTLLALMTLATALTLTVAQFEWFQKDKFDEIWRKIHVVNAQSCVTARPSDLVLPIDVVTQIPNVKRAEIIPLRRNRTGIMHVYNTAINRAFFWSYVLQRLYDEHEPGLQYYYLSQNADVMANKIVNASTLIFDNSCSYPNFYYNFFNKTIPLYGPSCFRDDNDYEDSTNWLGIPTMKTVSCDDLGAGVQNNYTNPFYRPRMNPWYEKWLPDLTKDGTKAVYTITLQKTDNKTGEWLKEEKFSVYGPPAPEDNPGPVKWTAPYFDCGGSNKWVVSAVSPIVDLYPRHPWAFINGERIEWRHVQYQKYVALAIMNVDLIRIDINQCPKDSIHTDDNYFGGTAKCKSTTMCEPIHGYGFMRGGYKCVCKPGYRYPFFQKGPFLGEVIERATNEEYERNFDCLEVRDKFVIPDQSSSGLNPDVDRNFITGRKKRSVQGEEEEEEEEEDEEERKRRSVIDEIFESDLSEEEVRSRFERQAEEHERVKRQAQVGEMKIEDMYKMIKEQESFIGFHRLYQHLTQVNDITRDNCQTQRAENLTMPGDVAFNVSVYFDEQARAAVRLAKFISNYLQTVDPNEKFTGRKGDHLLSEEELIGEVLAAVVSDRKIWGAGVYWDLNAYPKTEGRPRFAPHAFPTETQDKINSEKKDTRTFRVRDIAGDYNSGRDYLEKDWFRNMKARWRTTVDDLQLETQKFNIRSSPAGVQKIRFEHYPQQYFSADYEDGTWTNPYFNCDGPVYHWLLSYVIPFFGPNILGVGSLEFKGLVRIDVKLKDLDINQCDMEAWVPNAFKNTHRCDRETTYCEPYPEQGFITGAYMCLCKQGYEYPWEDIGRWYDGQQMELHFSRKLRGENNRYDRLKCRLAGAADIRANVIVVGFLSVVAWALTK